MKPITIMLTVLLALGAATTAHAAEPRLVRSEPAVGATDVAVDVGALRCTFDQNMKQNQWSIVEAEQGTFPPLDGDRAARWIDSRTFELRLARLEPGVTYAVQLNSPWRDGFQTAADQTPLPTTVVHFTTAGARDRESPRDDAPNRYVKVDPEGGSFGDPAKLIGDIPGLTVTGPPPNWIGPGLRLTYYAMYATLPDGPYKLIPDADGILKDKNGQRYNIEKMSKKASHGYMQANVVAMDERDAAVQMAFFLFEGMNEHEPIFKFDTGYVASATTGGDLWMHPDALAELAREASDQPPFDPTEYNGMWIRRRDYTIDNATYDALQIISVRDSGKGVWIYDMASGILLYASDVTALDVQKNRSGQDLSPGGSTVRFTTFKGSRDLDLPWKDDPSPSWLGKIRHFDYEGDFNVHVPGSPPTPFKLSVAVEVQRSGPGWMLSEATSRAQTPGALPDVGIRIGGDCQLGGGWISAHGLQRLEVGQVIDEDPLTRVRTVVDHVDREFVTLRQEGPRQQAQLTYRKTNGMLVRMQTSERIGPPGMRNEIDLYLTGSR
jgi:hypothetical protein